MLFSRTGRHIFDFASRRRFLSTQPNTEHIFAYEPGKQGVNTSDQLRSLGIARYLAWVTLVLVLLLTTVLSTYIGNVARETLLGKQKEFSSLLAENLHHQIYRRFALPTMLGFGRIELKLQFQYERLGQVILSTIHGLHVEQLRIYAEDSTISYSTNAEEAGEKIEDPTVQQAITGEASVFTIEASMPYWKAFFYFPLEPNTYILKTTYPLRLEAESAASKTGHLMGVLQFSRDITSDMENAIRFQQMIVLVTLLGSMLLMFLLLVFIRRAERAMIVRMDEEQKLLFELHQNEKLAGMGRVIASIAHEIRNPLGIIRSSAELLLKRNNGTDKVTAKIMQAIYDEAKRLSQTVSDFLDYARPRQARQDKVDVGLVLDQAFAFLEGELHIKDISVVRVMPSSRCQVLGDSDLLYRVFYNIIANAMQAMDTEGTLTVSVRVVQGSAPVVEVQFHDSGPGFPEEHLASLLDPFFTTKSDGTGLGLPIVSSIVGGQGGSLQLSNAPEGGAVVLVSMPAIP